MRAKLEHPIALGYCSVGRVVGVGDGASSEFGVRSLEFPERGSGGGGRSSVDGNDRLTVGSVDGPPLSEGNIAVAPTTDYRSLTTDFRIGDRVVSNSPNWRRLTSSV